MKSKKNFLLITIIILSVFIMLFLLKSVLLIESVDEWITAKISSSDDDDGFILNTRRGSGVYSLNETKLPCMYAKDEKLYMVVGEDTIDVTPEGINMFYYSQVTDFNEMLNKKENYLISSDEKYILYRLIFKGNPYLYFLDIENQKFIFISDRVDSFDFIKNENDNKITIIYTTGYEQSNKLLSYNIDLDNYSNNSYQLLSENISDAGIFDKYNSVVYLENDGQLYKYDNINGSNICIQSNVESVYFPGEDHYNYDDYYSSFTVCVKIAGKDYIVNETSKVEIKGGYYNIIPKFIYNDGNGNIYYYSINNKRLILNMNGEEILLYDEIGEIYRIFDVFVDENSLEKFFVVATEQYLYLFKNDGSKAERLMELPEDYCESREMLEKHMEIYPVSKDVIYVNLLCEGSLILNNKNTDSWLCNFESYNYGLAVVSREENGFKKSHLEIPPSRKMSTIFKDAIDSDKYMYLSYFEDGSVKAASLIDSKGKVLVNDILGTSTLAKGQGSLKALPCNNATYFLYKNKEGNLYFYKFDSNKLELQHVENENGIITENYEEFNSIVSFGTLVIF